MAEIIGGLVIVILALLGVFFALRWIIRNTVMAGEYRRQRDRDHGPKRD